MADLAKIQRAIANAKANGDLAAASRMEAYLSQLQSNPPPGVVGRDWDTVASQAAKNFGPSLYNYGSDMVTAVTNPIDTIGTLGDLGAGALREGAKAVLPTPVFDTLDSIGNQQAGKRASAVANAVGGHYKGRYGSWEGFKQGIAEDPVGVMSDLSLPVTGAGGLVARTGGVTGKIGRFAQVAGDMLDPVSAAIRSGRAGGRAVSSIAGYASGMGDEPARSIFNARRAGGPQAEAANRGMRSPPRDELADEAFAKMDVRRRQAQADYQNEIAATHGSNARINWNNIFRSIHDTLRSNMTVRGNRFYGGPSGRKMMQDVLSTVQEYVADPALHNLEGLDALKKELSLLQEPIGAQPAKGAENSNRLVSEVIDGVKDEIIRLEPSYATASENYQVWKELQGELRKALSLNDKAAADTVMRKLQSTMRNNVQTNYGSRTQLLDELDSVSAPSRPGRPELHAGTLRAELAGQAANTWMPRGIARSGGAFAIPAGIAAASGVLVNNPGYAALAAPFIPMASPRLVGEVAGLLGSGARVVDDAAAASPEIARAARAATGRVGRQVNRQIGQAVNEREGIIQDANGVWYDINGNIVQ
jgi:hypothetical protein